MSQAFGLRYKILGHGDVWRASGHAGLHVATGLDLHIEPLLLVVMIGMPPPPPQPRYVFRKFPAQSPWTGPVIRTVGGAGHVAHLGKVVDGVLVVVIAVGSACWFVVVVVVCLCC